MSRETKQAINGISLTLDDLRSSLEELNKTIEVSIKTQNNYLADIAFSLELIANCINKKDYENDK